MRRQKTGYFLPNDWILWQGEDELQAIKLSSGDLIRIEGASLTDSEGREPGNGLSASVWESLGRFEPLVGQLRGQLREHALQPLTRETVLRGSGWTQLFVELTGRCNERCVHCYAESSPTRTEALTWPQIRSALTDAKTLGFRLVQLTGGDPLLSPHCLRAVEAANELGIPQVEIYTNGLALRGKTYERLRELSPSFAFSFYSHDPACHDAITRTAGSHARTSVAIRRAVEDGLRVRIGVISMEQNRGDASQTRDYLVELGVAPDTVRFDRMRDVGRGHPMAELAGPRGVPNEGGIETPKPRGFGGVAAVSYDGTVYPCIFSRHLALGSVRDSGLARILSSAEPIAPTKRGLQLARARWAEKLACWQCQTRSVLLGGSSHA